MSAPVDVLAVWAEMADTIATRRDECLERGKFIQAEIYREMLARHSRSMIAVAELVEALAEVKQWSDVSGLEDEWPSVMDRVNAALARVKGGA